MGTWKALKNKHFTADEQVAFMAEALAMGLPELRVNRSDIPASFLAKDGITIGELGTRNSDRKPDTRDSS